MWDFASVFSLGFLLCSFLGGKCVFADDFPSLSADGWGQSGSGEAYCGGVRLGIVSAGRSFVVGLMVAVDHHFNAKTDVVTRRLSGQLSVPICSGTCVRRGLSSRGCRDRTRTVQGLTRGPYVVLKQYTSSVLGSQVGMLGVCIDTTGRSHVREVVGGRGLSRSTTGRGIRRASRRHTTCCCRRANGA